MRVESGPGWELRCGDYREVLSDVECDAVITDPPYSERTHGGQRTGSSTRKTTLTYNHMTRGDTEALAEWAMGSAEWWSIVFGDHLQMRWLEGAFERGNWYSFAPVMAVRTCPTPRMSGDGPTSSCDRIMVARPRHRLPKDRVGSRPGHYLVRHMNGRMYAASRWHPGGKDVDLMQAIVRDYSRPGDLVCDPCAGGGTTLLAAVTEGRRAIGAELDPETFELAVKRLRRGYTPLLPGFA